MNLFKTKKRFLSITAFLLSAVMLTACTSNTDNPEDGEDSKGETTTNGEQNTTSEIGESDAQKTKSEELKKYFDEYKFTKSLKTLGYNNPLMTQRFGADPTVLSYDGRVYVYMTADAYEYDTDGTLKENSYGQIRSLNLISSADLVNWTDHGSVSVAGNLGTASWAANSWAPSIVHKEIDGKDKFFLYFANNASGIGVLESDSPTGPFVDPIGKALISRSTPNCNTVTWLFDPGVFIDDDGTPYIYFGGGIPDDAEGNPMNAAPGTARMAQLGDDMISLATEPVALDIPYLFEALDMIKIDDTYYLSYCTNWSIDAAGNLLGLSTASIAYLTASSPWGPFELQESVYRNPGDFFKYAGNNHQCIFEHNGEYYIAYHAMMLGGRMNDGSPMGYRSTHLDKVTINDDGTIKVSEYTEAGVEAVGNLNPFEKNEAVTIGVMAGLDTKYLNENEDEMIVTDINTGDWLLVYGADFGDGADKLTVSITGPVEELGVIEIRLGNLGGEVVGYLEIEADDSGEFREITADLDKKITGVNNVVFAFYGEGYDFQHWYFS